MRYLIGNYINKITADDIIKFACDNDIVLTDNEVDILEYYLKNNWQDLLYGDPLPIISDMKMRLGSKGDDIISPYYIYKEKYKNYL